MSPIVKIDRPSKQLQVTWAVSNLCNYRCSYCTEDLWRGDQRSPNATAYKAAFRQIFSHYRERGFERIHFVFTGGEPTFWQPLEEMIEFFKAETPFEHSTFSITTNLSNSLSWWQRHYDLFTDVMASFHVERGQPERFLEILQFLEDKCFLNIHLMMHEERFAELVSLGDEIQKCLKNFSLDYVPLLTALSPSAPAYQYKNLSQMEFLRRHATPVKSYRMPMSRPLSYGAGAVLQRRNGSEAVLYPNQLISAGENFFKGWSCHLDEFIMINPNGSAQYGSCGVGKPLGNINRGQLQLPEQISRCPRTQCFCGSDILVRKSKGGWFNPLLSSFHRGLPRGV